MLIHQFILRVPRLAKKNKKKVHMARNMYMRVSYPLSQSPRFFRNRFWKVFFAPPEKGLISRRSRNGLLMHKDVKSHAFLNTHSTKEDLGIQWCFAAVTHVLYHEGDRNECGSFDLCAEVKTFRFVEYQD